MASWSGCVPAAEPFTESRGSAHCNPVAFRRCRAEASKRARNHKRGGRTEEGLSSTA